MKEISIDKYERGEKLGSGTFGILYALIDPNSTERYAAKEINMDVEKKISIKIFNQEISAYLKLDNPSILKFYGYSKYNTLGEWHPTIIFELVENDSLSKNLKNKQFSSTSRYIALIGIAIGIKYLHSQGIVHRDLKPQNILLDKNFYPKICDFGSSAISNVNLDHFNMEYVVGTVLYSAPEILRFKDYTYKVDIFSLSFVAYEILTGKELFDLRVYNTKNKVAKAIKKGKRPDLTKIPDKNIQKFLQKCWSDNPSKRPNSNEVVKELLNERYQKYFNADKKEVSKYLNLFDKKLLNPNQFKEFQKKNDQIYYIGDCALIFIFLILFAFISNIIIQNKIIHSEKLIFLLMMVFV